MVLPCAGCRLRSLGWCPSQEAAQALRRRPTSRRTAGSHAAHTFRERPSLKAQPTVVGTRLRERRATLRTPALCGISGRRPGASVDVLGYVERSCRSMYPNISRALAARDSRSLLKTMGTLPTCDPSHCAISLALCDCDQKLCSPPPYPCHFIRECRAATATMQVQTTAPASSDNGPTPKSDPK